MPVEKIAVQREFEGGYLLDYALFTGALRDYVTRSLEAHFAADRNDAHRRLFVLALFRELYTAYEDLGAMLDALISQRLEPSQPIVARLMSYRPIEVRLTDMFERFEIASWQMLYDRLGVPELLPRGWAQKFPDYNLERVLRVGIKFFFEDCARAQDEQGVRAFNKLKHGLLAVPSGRWYLPETLPDVPAMIFATDDSDEGVREFPLTAYAVTMHDDMIAARLKAIHFVQAILRMISALLVVTQHPEAAERRKPGDPLNVFEHPHLRSVMHFVKQVTDTLPDPT